MKLRNLIVQGDDYLQGKSSIKSTRDFVDVKTTGSRNRKT